MQKVVEPMSEIFFALCKSVDSPLSLGAWIRFSSGEHKSLAELRAQPKDYLHRESFRKDYLICSFLSKWKGLKTGIDLEAVATQSFASAEVSCKNTNTRLKEARRSIIDPTIAGVFYAARRKIALLLGQYTYSKLERGFGWGPGATSDMVRRRAFVDTKISELPISVSRSAAPLAKAVISHDLHWSAVILGRHPEEIQGPFSILDNVFLFTEDAVVEFVPKTAKTHRTIAKEPRLNGFLQKGFGFFIRERLKRVGIDLDRQDLNQDGACRAFDERLATIDLSAASDSVAKELVHDLLPLDWACALNSVRSHWARMPGGRRVLLEKFSSMGNGFTFELESLIFWALTSSVADLYEDKRVWIYGDDIICSQAAAPLVVDVLRFAGFETNLDKSFLSGNFFESCGRHYWQGIDVTPIYQKETLENPLERIRLGNRLIRLCLRVGLTLWAVSDKSSDLALWVVPRAAWLSTRRLFTEYKHCFLPLGVEGDEGWVVPHDWFGIVTQDINLGFRCRTVKAMSRRLPANDKALLAWTLRRGVVTDSPFYGELVAPSPETTESTHLVRGHRWVYPTWEFSLTW